MKTCPNCHTQYTDDTLRFCLQDGAVLEPAPVTQQPTVSLAGQEMETLARQGPPGRSNEPGESDWKQESEVTRVSAPPSRPRSVTVGSRWALAAAVLVLVLILLGGVGAVALWLYFGQSGPDTANIKGGVNRNGTLGGNNDSSRTPTNPPTPSTTPAVSNSNRDKPREPSPAPPTDVDRSQASREVTQQVYGWKANTETGDLDAQMRRYASSVDYYRKRGATPGLIRADKMRAYRLFDSMSITISNLNVTIDDSGETATALFDKEWVFEGKRRSTGKVRQQLQFRRIDGQWLITAERDLKVY